MVQKYTQELFDKDYATVTVIDYITQEKAYHPADGRSYYAGFKYNFQDGIIK